MSNTAAILCTAAVLALGFALGNAMVDRLDAILSTLAAMPVCR